jgi:hypothetical protein
MSDGDSLYAWQVQEPDGRWSMVAAGFSVDVQMPLIHRSLEFIQSDTIRALAEAHADVTSQPLRLAHFTLSDVVEKRDWVRG